MLNLKSFSVAGLFLASHFLGGANGAFAIGFNFNVSPSIPEASCPNGYNPRTIRDKKFCCTYLQGQGPWCLPLGDPEDLPESCSPEGSTIYRESFTVWNNRGECVGFNCKLEAQGYKKLRESWHIINRYQCVSGKWQHMCGTTSVVKETCQKESIDCPSGSCVEKQVIATKGVDRTQGTPSGTGCGEHEAIPQPIDPDEFTPVSPMGEPTPSQEGLRSEKIDELSFRKLFESAAMACGKKIRQFPSVRN